MPMVPMRASCRYPKAICEITILYLSLLCCATGWSQVPLSKPGPPAETKPELPKDTLGRNTPRGTVMGFLAAERKGNREVAALYLNTPLRGKTAEDLAYQLALILNRRLPARLNQLSDEPEGGVPNPLKPDEDLVGTISTAEGNLDILLERVDRGKAGRVWLFSDKTLSSIPGVYEELNAAEIPLPEFLVKHNFLNIPLSQWLAVFVGMPLVYLLTGLCNRLLSSIVGALRRRQRKNPDLQNPEILIIPIRLLLLALVLHWLASKVGVSLLSRQFWSSATVIIAIAACTWLLIVVNGWMERCFASRLRHRNLSGSTSVLRLARRLVDVLVLFAGLLFTLHHFGINPTAALAGLGVGGIAIALAAQKTLENVIAGISLIADQAVRAGDTLKLGDIVGTVEDVGLRSTRIRTLDRTLVSVPNGQIANMSLETLSARDKFWFHPIIGLRYETTADQLRSVIADATRALKDLSYVDSGSVRVRFLRFASFSLDVEVFAYLAARDWNQFLERQEDVLLKIMDIVQKAKTEIAFPSQTMYLAGGAVNNRAELIPARDTTRRTSVSS